MGCGRYPADATDARDSRRVCRRPA